MFTWKIGILGSITGRTYPALGCVPVHEGDHEPLATRMRAGGMQPVSLEAWHAADWPLTACSVSVEPGPILIELHTGRSRILCSPPVALTERWADLAMARRYALLCLLPAGVLQVGATGEPLAGEELESMSNLCSAAAEAGTLLAGIANVLYGPAPFGGIR